MYTKKLMTRIYAAGMAAVCVLVLAACYEGPKLADYRYEALGHGWEWEAEYYRVYGVTAYQEDSNSIRITWGTVRKASFYYVYKSNSEKGPFVNIAKVAQTTYEDQSVSSISGGGAAWYYKVSAVDSYGFEAPQSDAALVFVSGW